MLAAYGQSSKCTKLFKFLGLNQLENVLLENSLYKLSSIYKQKVIDFKEYLVEICNKWRILIGFCIQSTPEQNQNVSSQGPFPGIVFSISKIYRKNWGARLNCEIPSWYVFNSSATPPASKSSLRFRGVLYTIDIAMKFKRWISFLSYCLISDIWQ